jgi:hypothetical protein
MDVFLTPLFGKWLPRHCNDFYVGRGGYSNDFNQNRLHRIANNLNLKFGNKWNLGSTWISTPDQFRLISYLTLTGMAYLAFEEFSEPERKGKVGVELWPDWHYGVLLLYGQNIAMNHVIGSSQLNIVSLYELVDFPTTESSLVTDVLHLHVFHSDLLFSKFAFKDGKYNDMKVSDEQAKHVKHYALKMALEGNSMPGKDLYNMFVNQISNKKE